MDSYLRIIGDIHGKTDEYLNLARQAEYSIQLGDFGFNYSSLGSLDSNFHKVLGGNHDNYEKRDDRFIYQTPHFLGDFGTYSIPGYDIFFVRGGNSIDKKERMLFYNWWPDEELSYSKSLEALDLYEATKPNFMISHECPASVIPNVTNRNYYYGQELIPSMTANLLDTMLEIHKPKIWLFGHHHKNVHFYSQGTNFSCIQILDYIDFDKVEGI